MGLETISQENIKYKAADLNKDNILSQEDYNRIKNYIMER